LPWGAKGPESTLPFLSVTGLSKRSVHVVRADTLCRVAASTLKMSTEHDTTTTRGEQDDSDIPVNQVYVSDSGRQLIIEECVRCGETHSHGARDVTVASGGRSHRASHCTNNHLDGGYELELAEDADPPEHWWSWMRDEAGGSLE